MFFSRTGKYISPVSGENYIVTQCFIFMRLNSSRSEIFFPSLLNFCFQFAFSPSKWINNDDGNSKSKSYLTSLFRSPGEEYFWVSNIERNGPFVLSDQDRNLTRLKRKKHSTSINIRMSSTPSSLTFEHDYRTKSSDSKRNVIIFANQFKQLTTINKKFLILLFI